MCAVILQWEYKQQQKLFFIYIFKVWIDGKAMHCGVEILFFNFRCGGSFEWCPFLGLV